MATIFTLIYGVRTGDGEAFAAREVAGTFATIGAAEAQMEVEMEGFSEEFRAEDDAFIVLRSHGRTGKWDHVSESFPDANAHLDGLEALGFVLFR